MENFEEYQELIESLGIDDSKVYRILLSDGTDIVTEVLPFNGKSKKITAVNPLRILKDHFIDDGLLMGSEILVLFDPSIENPMIEFNRSLIITMYKVDGETIERYALTLFDHYFPLDVQIDLDEPKKSKISKKSIKTNIVSFIEYKDKRTKGIF